MTVFAGRECVFGCDVSRWQNGINYSVFDLDFVIYKATGGDGGLYVDPKFRENADGFNTAEGPYHFASAARFDPVVEANFFCDTILNSSWATMPADRKLPPTLDWEPTSGTVMPDVALGFVLRFCEQVTARTGMKPLIYTGAYISLTRDVRLIEYDLWLAAYTPQPIPCAPWPSWSVWQNSSTGSIRGIAGNCDTDAADAAWFARVLGGTPSPVQPSGDETVTPDDINAVAQKVVELLGANAAGNNANSIAALQDQVGAAANKTIDAVNIAADRVVRQLGANGDGNNAFSIAEVLNRVPPKP